MCCQRIAEPPLAGFRNAPPVKFRSMNSRTSAVVNTGIANSARLCVTSTVQTKIGSRNIRIPGARIRKIVARKLTAPRIELKPSTVRPMIQRSTPVPSPGPKLVPPAPPVESGA